MLLTSYVRIKKLKENINEKETYQKVIELEEQIRALIKTRNSHLGIVDYDMSNLIADRLIKYNDLLVRISVKGLGYVTNLTARILDTLHKEK